MAQMRLLLPSPSIRIDPDRLMGMLLWGIVCGAVLGVLWDVFRLTRVMLGFSYPSRSADKLYAQPLPLLGKTLPRHSGQKKSLCDRLGGVILFAEDVVFGLVCGVVMSLLVYVTNDGIFRAMAPIGMLIGFLIYYLTVGRLVLSVSQILVFALRALALYALTLLLLPPRLAVRLWQRTFGAWIKRICQVRREKRAAQYHAEMLKRLTQLAQYGYLCEQKIKNRKKGGWRYAANRKTSQENDPRVTECSALSDADCDFCHHLFCDQADGEQQAQEGTGCTAGADRRGQTKGLRPAIRRRGSRGRKLRGGLGQG